MFGIGPMELTIIAVVALLIFGPEKLPEMMGQAGKLVRDFRNMTAEMSGEFEKTVAEAKGITKDLQGEVGSMRNQVNSVSRSVQKDLGVGGKTTSGAKKTQTTSRKSTSGSKSGTAKKSTTAKSGAGSKTTGSKGSSAKGNTSSSSSEKTAGTGAAKAASKPATPQSASREDPTAAISLFEPAAPRRERRARKATLSAFGESTPRSLPQDGPAETASDLAASVGGGSNGSEQQPVDLNDPLVRARQRRRTAGYARSAS